MSLMTFWKANWKSSTAHEKKRFESWRFSFSLKMCLTKGKCVIQGMSKMCHSGYVYCISSSRKHTMISGCTIFSPLWTKKGLNNFGKIASLWAIQDSCFIWFLQITYSLSLISSINSLMKRAFMFRKWKENFKFEGWNSRTTTWVSFFLVERSLFWAVMLVQLLPLYIIYWQQLVRISK